MLVPVSVVALAMLIKLLRSGLPGIVPTCLANLMVFMILIPLVVGVAPATASQTIGPALSSVSKVSSDLKQNVTITGSGFGSIPPQTMVLGDGSVNTYGCAVSTPYMALYDFGPGSDSWEAGWQSCSNSDLIGIHLSSWNDSVIVIAGFGSRLGNASAPATWNISTGDLFGVAVWGPYSSGRVTVELRVGSSTSALSPLVMVTSMCVNGLSIQVNGAVKESTGVSFDWGDGVTTSGFFPEAHLYGGSGAFTVRVTASNATNGLSSYVSSNTMVAPAVMNGCASTTLSAGTGGSISYTSPPSLSPAGLSGTIPQGGSFLVYTASEVTLNLTAEPTSGFSFSSWLVSGGVRGVGSLASPSVIVRVSQTGNVEGVFSPNPDFQVSANPDAVAIEAGSSGSSIVTVASENQFHGTVTLAATTAYGDLSFAPSSATVVAGGSALSTLTINVKSSTTPGTYSVLIAVTAGTIEHDATLKVTVTPQPVKTSSQPPGLDYFFVAIAAVIAALVIFAGAIIYRSRRRRKTENS